MARVSIEKYAEERGAEEVRDLVNRYNVDLQTVDSKETIDGDKLNNLFQLEAEAKRAQALQVELDEARARLDQPQQSNSDAKIAAWGSALSAVAAFIAAGLSLCSVRTAEDQLKSTLAATDAKNRYEVQILVANKMNDIASSLIALNSMEGDKSSAKTAAQNMLFSLDETFVIANDLHKGGGFVSGWDEFIKRNCDRLHRNAYFNLGDQTDLLSQTRAICVENGKK